MPPKKPRAPPAEPLMHGIYCHRYYEKNREEINEKTRDRMRRLRASDVTVPPEVLAARLEARRAAAKRYRQRHQHQLKMKAREARAQAAEERRHAKEKRERRERREAARRCAAECAETASHFCLNRRDSDERYLAQRQGNWDHVGRTSGEGVETFFTDLRLRLRQTYTEEVSEEDALRLIQYETFIVFNALRLALELQAQQARAARL
ncbi:hypothetical protein B0H11DRAFT_1945717 [Mycena galericulata]|nr:hypothetical protein B0H11DRAFT_1945717 [Mycena galericulata]